MHVPIIVIFVHHHTTGLVHSYNIIDYVSTNQNLIAQRKEKKKINRMAKGEEEEEKKKIQSLHLQSTHLEFGFYFFFF